VTTLPPDDAARRRIAEDLGSTLFVEAGAGAGKTRSLVDRVVNVVESGVPITSIAAITFTEKAAAELRHRIRTELLRRDVDWARAAVSDLDAAPIGTLHAFARRILGDFPIDASLPPGFGVLDELASDIRFDDEWNELIDRLLADADPEGGSLDGGSELVELSNFENFGIEKGLKRVADDFRHNWDLVELLVDRTAPPNLDLEVDDVVAAARAIAATTTPDDDRQAEIVAGIGSDATRLADATDLTTRLESMQSISATIGKARHGNKTKWKSLGVEALEELRARETDLAELIEHRFESVRAHRKTLVGAIAGRFVLESAAERVAAGHLDFHDLLVRARSLLATNATVRRLLHDRYERVLLDEFQDTDPIQLEIAVRLTAAPDDPAQDAEWRDLVPLPGRLFIVGDPKQSIYRFRRADIEQYLRAADQIGADTERLTANFRSTTAVIDFTNDLFERLIRRDENRQPDFQALDASRAHDLLDHGSTSLVGVEHHGDLADGSWADEAGNDHGVAEEVRRREAVDVAATVVTALDEGWPIGDDDGTTRPCRPGDICILLPTRISLPMLEAELRSAGVRYRAENSAVVYESAEVRDLLLALRASDDPTDELAIVASLRSQLYGCSDVELYEWRRAGGRWGLWSTPPDGLEHHAVAEGLAHLRSVHDRTSVARPADLLVAIADERRLLDAALLEPDGRDVWRRFRFVVDQARSWAEAGGRGVRRYLRWANLQAADAQISETMLPEHDDDAVRVMTIHAAKGLEFPITIVSGTTTRPRRRAGTEVVWSPDSWHLSGRGDDGSFAEIRPIDELMSDAERRRLLYVACTRAVDHLVVSIHRHRPDDKVDELDEGSLTSAELLWRNGAVEAAPSAVAVQTSLALGQSTSRSDSVPRDELDDADWWAELSETMERSRRPSAIAATRLAEEVRLARERELVDDPGLDKQPVNIDLPPWQRGRYGTAIGRAVHGTLQFCDLDTGSDIDGLARSQCAAEGIIGVHRSVAALARSAITAPIVRDVVAGCEHWRELFIAAPVGNRLLEGYIDLLVRTSSGLVIVDYKTDRWSGPVQSAERIGRYRIQLASYAAALESMLGEPIGAGVLVRCRPGESADQIEIDDWTEAIAEVQQLIG
jgi:ATP-dependent helicase/nuclease subunit A